VLANVLGRLPLIHPSPPSRQVLPPLFNGIGSLEGKLCFDKVLLLTFRRYYAFMVINILLVTTISNSIFEKAGLIAENPGNAFQLLGYTLPFLLLLRVHQDLRGAGL